MSHSPCIGLIAGGGELPLLFARQAKQKGYTLKTAALRGSASPSLEKLSESFQWISLGQLGVLLNFFKKQGVKRAVMHGKVQHAQLFRNLKLDWRALKVWSRLKDHSGESLLKAVAAEMRHSGISLLDERTLMGEYLIPKGSLTRLRPDQKDRQAITYGLKKARALARAGIGQTIIVKKNAVAAVEALEGTDEAIRRAGKWAGPGAIAIKVASPRQDWRFDIPTLGPKTLQSLIQSRAKGLVVEARRTFLLEREKITAMAEKNGLYILAV